jgi:hypothetical protein
MERALPACVATGFVDLKTGMLLGVKTVDMQLDEIETAAG